MFGLYGLLLRLAWAVVLPYQIVMARLQGEHAPSFLERLARHPALGEARAGGFWVHAVSVGEVRLALTVIAGLRRRMPGLPIHLTTCTRTGRALATEAIRSADPGRPDSVSDLPLDLPGPVGRLLDHLRPAALVIIETELWPNLIRISGDRRVPVFVVNGRISERSFPRYRWLRPLLARALPRAALFVMQSADDAARLATLGAPAHQVVIGGNLKFDLPAPRVDASEVRRRIGAAPDETVLVAGSTARGEEDAVLGAFAALRRARPDSRLVLAPRHPEDLEAARDASLRAGLRLLHWSAIASGGTRGSAASPPPYDVLLVDVVGVLPEVYAAATLAFVGGSLVPRGGQNLLEPAAQGKPVLFGPHVENFRAVARDLGAQGGGFMARDPSDLAALVLRLASDKAALDAAGASARRVVEGNRGALTRTLDYLEAALRVPPSLCASTRT
jgi:3-deoxy-D-manno-octulosonic-acid transferase